MNGREFLETAQRLSTSQTPADLRSAVSRAYYAAFHAVHDCFNGCGIRLSRNSPAAHTQMPQCLQNCNIPELIALGGKLHSLREDRNDADYHLDVVEVEETDAVAFMVDVARGILQSVDLLAAQPQIVRLLQHRARALGLHVV